MTEWRRDRRNQAKLQRLEHGGTFALLVNPVSVTQPAPFWARPPESQNHPPEQSELEPGAYSLTGHPAFSGTSKAREIRSDRLKQHHAALPAGRAAVSCCI